MTDTDNVFTDVIKTEPTNISVEPKNELTGTVAELVGESKKFKTVEALAASVNYKDEHIAKLEAENRNLREKTVNADEVFNKLLESKEKENTKTTVEPLTTDEIQRIVQDTLTKTKTQDEATTNIKKANDTLVQKLGGLEKAQDFLKQKSIELGLGIEFLMSTAAKSPSAFLKVIGVDEQKSNPQNNPIIQGTKNTDGQTEFKSGLSVGTVEYYREMYRTNPSKYMSAKVQTEIMDYATKGIYKA